MSAAVFFMSCVDMTRETLVKIERGIQHIQASQLRGIRDVLKTTYDEMLREGDCPKLSDGV